MRVVKIIGLKILELIGVFLVYYLLCLLYSFLPDWLHIMPSIGDYPPFWMYGGLLIIDVFLVVAFSFLLIAVIVEWIRLNIKWVDKLGG